MLNTKLDHMGRIINLLRTFKLVFLKKDLAFLPEWSQTQHTNSHYHYHFLSIYCIYQMLFRNYLTYFLKQLLKLSISILFCSWSNWSLREYKKFARWHIDYGFQNLNSGMSLGLNYFQYTICSCSVHESH